MSSIQCKGNCRGDCSRSCQQLVGALDPDPLAISLGVGDRDLGLSVSTMVVCENGPEDSVAPITACFVALGRLGEPVELEPDVTFFISSVNGSVELEFRVEIILVNASSLAHVRACQVGNAVLLVGSLSIVVQFVSWALPPAIFVWQICPEVTLLHDRVAHVTVGVGTVPLDFADVCLLSVRVLDSNVARKFGVVVLPLWPHVAFAKLTLTVEQGSRFLAGEPVRRFVGCPVVELALQVAAAIELDCLLLAEDAFSSHCASRHQDGRNLHLFLN